ncbi:MAG: hypothetical protein QNJ07_06415 [Woeseiaceae bacterium]|nr:hypothetical protein [Woeseiaceae bacterium]
MMFLFAAGSSLADTEIHRCTQDDGTVAFQEMPCAEPAESNDDVSGDDEPVVEDDFFDFVNPFDEPPRPATETEPVSQDRAECEKLTRDAIDAIDLEMRETRYSKEQGDEYLAELLELTRQLRACKAL